MSGPRDVGVTGLRSPQTCMLQQFNSDVARFYEQTSPSRKRSADVVQCTPKRLCFSLYQANNIGEGRSAAMCEPSSSSDPRKSTPEMVLQRGGTAGVPTFELEDPSSSEMSMGALGVEGISLQNVDRRQVIVETTFENASIPEPRLDDSFSHSPVRILSQTNLRQPSTPRTMARRGAEWDDEELWLACTFELSWKIDNPGRTQGVVQNIYNNLRLFSFFRTKIAIQSMRETPRYKRMSTKVRDDYTASSVVESTPAVDPEDTERSYVGVFAQTNYASRFKLEFDLDEIVERATEGLDFRKSLNSLVASIHNVVVRGPRMRGPNTLTPRRAKVSNYKRLQIAYKKTRSKTCRKVVEGSLLTGSRPSEIHGFLDHWGNNCGGIDDQPRDTNEMESCGTDVYHSIWEPISQEELSDGLRGMKSDSASGPDGVTVSELKDQSMYRVWLEIFNLIIYDGKLPRSLKRSRTIFIPKANVVHSRPSDFRPISLSPVLLRLFHKILARRLVKLVNHDHRQRAFMPIDGCAENIVILEAVISEAKRRRVPVVIANLDISNAFGSVTHEAIVRALECSGAPKVFVEYIRDLYDSFSTELFVDESHKSDVRVTRGVFQGDPLSPILFNLVIDQALRRIPDYFGFKLSEDIKVSAMAFADDMTVVTSTSGGMQFVLDTLTTAVKPWGLEFNIKKCNFLALVRRRSSDGGSRQGLRADTDLSLMIGGDKLTGLSMTDSWRYLGALMTSNGLMCANLDLENWLKNVRTSKLKPQQKLYILKTHVIPKLIFGLCVSPMSKLRLHRNDLLIRKTLRKILHLDKSIPIAFFYAPVKGGGLGVMKLLHSIPMMVHNRFGKMLSSSNPVVAEAAALNANVRRLCIAASLTPDNCDPRNKSDSYNYLTKALYAHGDGKTLRKANIYGSGSAHSWISNGTTLIKGWLFCDALRVRINALPTKVRLSRASNSSADPNGIFCRHGCRDRTGQLTETNFHAIMQCDVSQGARIRRHNEIVAILAKDFIRRGWTVILERVFYTSYSRKIPDMICIDDNEQIIYVIDPTVVADLPVKSLSKAYRLKVAKYTTDVGFEIESTLLSEYPGYRIEVGALVISYQGIVEGNSFKWLRRTVGVPSGIITLCALKAVTGSVNCFRTFQRAPHALV